MKLYFHIMTSLLLVIGGTHQAQAANCFLDNYQYCWQFNSVNSTATANYYSGTMKNWVGGPFGAAATELNGIEGISAVSSDFGTSFHYNLKWTMLGGQGAWANSDGYGIGVITKFVPVPCPCDRFINSLQAGTVSAGPRPGE